MNTHTVVFELSFSGSERDIVIVCIPRPTSHLKGIAAPIPLLFTAVVPLRNTLDVKDLPKDDYNKSWLKNKKWTSN